MRYVIMPVSEVTAAQLKVCINPFLAQLRKISGDRVILKYTGFHPILFWGYTSYSATELLELISKEDM